METRRIYTAARRASRNLSAGAGPEGRRGLNRHFTGESEASQRESAVLGVLIGAAERVERFVEWARSSHVAQLVHPAPAQANSWGSENLTDSVLRDVKKQHLTAKRRDERVPGLPINRTERAIAVIPEAKEERFWELVTKLFRSKRYQTTQQQATVALYEVQPDFDEATFVQDVQATLLPSLLDAIWSRDVHQLKQMCSLPCYHLEVLPLLAQYDSLESRCRLLMSHSPQIFNRMMVVDDSDFALRELDDGEERVVPRPVLFVSINAHLIHCWVHRSQDRRVSDTVCIGDPHCPEDWVFVLGLTPEQHGRWSLAAMRFCRLDALA